MKEAAFIWAQKNYGVSFKGLDAHEKHPGVFKFVFEVDATQDQFVELLGQYMNQEALVEPKSYDQKMNNLRDNLRKAKSN
jgi:hypothetical protein